MEDLKVKEKVEDAKKAIDKTFEKVKDFSHKGRLKITERLKEVEGEFDLDRLLNINLSTLALTGAVLGYYIEKRWFAMTAAASLLLAVNALTGVVGKIPFLRKLGLRLKDEINHERYALKAFRGDFKHTETPEALWEASE